MKTFRNNKAILMLFILSLLLFPALSIAEYVGSFSRIEGRVDLLRAGATTVVPARQGDGVSTGDIIRTKSDGRAEILFKDDTTVTVASETRLKIDEYTFNPDNSRNKGILSLLRGKLRAAVSKVKAGLIPVSMGISTFNINTPTTVAGVRGTVLFVFYERGITGVVFKEGNGFVYNQNMPDRIVNVSEGQATFILTDNAPPLPPRPATDAEMSQHIKDTTIKETDTTPDTNNADIDSSDTDAGQTETTHVDAADIMTTLGETGGEDTSAPKTADTGVDSGPPPPVLPITETDTGTLEEVVPPLITITSSPQAITNSSSGSFTVTANEPVTFTYSMDSWGVTTTLTTSDTITLAGLPEGSHTLSITATDAAGNVSTSSYSWTTDYTVPVTIFTSSPSTLTNIPTANFGVSSSETSTYTYKLDGTTVASTNLTSVTEGLHTFVVTATDAAGNSSTSTYTWTTDYTAPVSLSLTSTPAAITNINSATIGATATDANGVTYRYTLDGATSTGALTGLTEGTHTFVATATDGAGNISTTSYTWTTDTIAPASLTLTGTPASITNINNATIGATANDATAITYSYTLDTAASTGVLTGLGEGLHTFVATATDGAGNTSTTSYTWTTDYTAPTASISPAASPELTGATAAINVNFGSTETATYSYQLDGGGMNNVTGSSVNLTGIAEGTHTIDYSATDTAGNPSTPNSFSFALSRYTLSGSASASGITGSITTGEVAGVSNQNWGGSKLVMSGTYTPSMSPSFTLYAGGTSVDATATNNGGYWIDIISGTSDGVSSLSGTSGLKYLSYDRLGSGTGSFTGSYGAGTWSATDTGTYTETPLAFSGNIGYDQNDQGLYTVDGLGINQIGNSYGGLLGGTTPSLSDPAITFIGPYWPSTAGLGPFIWTPVIYSANGSFSFAPSYDGNKFWGYIGGTWKDRAINGRVYSLYIDSSGNAGILRGSLAGAYYPELSMLQADGTWTPTIMGTGVSQTALPDLTYPPPSYTWSSTTTTFSGSGGLTQGGFPLDTAMFVTGAEGRKDSISGGNWGIWQTILGGTYTTLGSPDGWDLLTSVIDPPAGKISGTLSVGTWSVNQLAGTTYGYGADISTTPNTWISVGETIGTFDPGALTWQAVQTGAWIDTNRFLAMTTADQAKLAQLNIPFVEVGRAGLTGSGTIGGSPATVNMNNVIFFAYSSGAAPKVWATGDVQGTYTCSACGGGVIPVAGNGLSATFNVQTFDTAGQKWIATVAGGGSYTGTGTMSGTNVIMDGAAAGTNSGGIGGTFSGTGAGVAQ